MKGKPYFQRSPLWDRREEIQQWVQQGYSFKQIAEELTSQGLKISDRWLQSWYLKNVGRRRRPRTPRSPKSETTEQASFAQTSTADSANRGEAQTTPAPVPAEADEQPRADQMSDSESVGTPLAARALREQKAEQYVGDSAPSPIALHYAKRIIERSKK